MAESQGGLIGPLTIARLGVDGDGIAETSDGPVYIRQGLPGETFAGPDADAPLRPSPERIVPPCRHFGACGGCVAQHMANALYRDWKRGIVVEAFRARGLAPEIRPLLPIPPGTRRRAVLTAHRTAQGVTLGFHGRSAHTLHAIEDCNVLAPPIVAALPTLRDISALALALDTVAKVTVTSTETGLSVLVAGGKSTLDADRLARLAALAAGARIARLAVNGMLVAERARPRLTMSGVAIAPPADVFLQAVPEAERAMVELILAGVGKARQAADLFSGIGPFALALARRAKVLAVDSDKRAIAALDAASRNAQGLRPIETRVRDLFREPLARIELKSFDAVVLDPPRAGAKAQVEMIACSAVPLIAMVSCNPATLARDCRALADAGFRLGPVTPIDQFLWSAHVEAVVIAKR
jgi:23S rRNA (uracil1939-C5)-methyltransferase